MPSDVVSSVPTARRYLNVGRPLQDACRNDTILPAPQIDGVHVHVECLRITSTTES